MNNSVEKLVKDLNEFSHRNNFEVPVLDGFEKIKTNGDNIIPLNKYALKILDMQRILEVIDGN